MDKKTAVSIVDVLISLPGPAKIILDDAVSVSKIFANLNAAKSLFMNFVIHSSKGLLY